jgi:NADH:ubiquinone oxidoreductase subunit D
MMTSTIKVMINGSTFELPATAMLADAVAMLGSLDLVIPEIDR